MFFFYNGIVSRRAKQEFNCTVQSVFVFAHKNTLEFILNTQKGAYVSPASVLMEPEIMNRCYFLFPATHVCISKDRKRFAAYTVLLTELIKKKSS